MKRTMISNYRVIIDPQIWKSYCEKGSQDDRWNRATCQGIIQDIERHVDDVGYVEYDYDEYSECSFCGSEWEEDEEGIPMCCQQAKDQMLADKIDQMVV